MLVLITKQIQLNLHYWPHLYNGLYLVLADVLTAMANKTHPDLPK